MNVEEKVEGMVNEIIAKEGLSVELVDVEYVKERDWYLRIFIDKSGGISVDDCQEMSELIGEALDEQDFIKDSYLLEVSSPGLDRRLRKPRDFVREKGRAVDVTLFAPEKGLKSTKTDGKLLTGILGDYDGKHLILENNTKDGEEKCVIPVSNIAAVRLHIDI